jgi:predicted GIY-YIG superfamily endonuclease
MIELIPVEDVYIKKYIEPHEHDRIVNDAKRIGVRVIDILKDVHYNNLREVPDICGVYILHKEDKIYIGKSKHIRHRLYQHRFDGVVDIYFTEKDYLAELLESYLIFKMKTINKAEGKYISLLKLDEK